MSEVIEFANTNQNQIVAADPYKNDLDRGKLCRDSLRLPTICLVLIIFIAFIIRMHFFIGFAGRDPQDDGIYINIAKGILQNGFYDHNIQKKMILHNPIINPIYMFPARLLMTYATACSFFLFGVSDYSAALFPLICSLLSIYIIYKIGLLLFNYRVGLFAGFFLAIMPLDIIFSLGVNALAHHEIRQRHPGGQHLHPYFPGLGFGAVFFNHLKSIGPTVVSHDDAYVFHRSPPHLRSALSWSV